MPHTAEVEGEQHWFVDASAALPLTARLRSPLSLTLVILPFLIRQLLLRIPPLLYHVQGGQAASRTRIIIDGIAFQQSERKPEQVASPDEIQSGAGEQRPQREL